MEGGPIEWFPLEIIEARILEFINIGQENISTSEYVLTFTQSSKYVPSIVAYHRANKSKFVSSVFVMAVKECRTAMHFHDIYISHRRDHSQKIEEENLKERSKGAKRARMDDGNCSHSRSGGPGRSRCQQKFSR